MHYQRFVSEGLAHFSYLVGDGGRAVVIDPRRDIEAYVAAALDAGLEIQFVLETHRNEDIVVGSAALAERTGAAVWHADAHLPYQYGEAVQDGQTWSLGSLTVEAMHTPGHTPGSMSYVLRASGGAPWMVFSGDLLFAGDVGRVDLAGHDAIAKMAGLLYDSLTQRVLPLGDGVLLRPAHGAGSACGATLADRDHTTIGLERALNPQLQIDSREAFVAAVSRELPFPPYFKSVERQNLRGATERAAPLGPVSLDDIDGAGATVVDLRHELGFAGAHIPGALSLPPGAAGRFGGWVLDPEEEVVLTGPGAPEVARLLDRMGYSRVLGELADGIDAYLRAGREPAGVRTISVQGLCRALDAGNDVWLFDVRSDEERAASAIPNAHGIDLRYLADQSDAIPQDRDVYLFCGSGRRAMVGAARLQHLGGFANLVVVLGGFAGWQARSCPIQRAR